MANNVDRVQGNHHADDAGVHLQALDTSETCPFGELLSTGATGRTWKLGNLSKLSSRRQYYSGVFVIGGCKWQLMVDPWSMDYSGLPPPISLNLFVCIADSSTQHGQWSVDAEFSFAVVDQKSKESAEYNEEHSFTPQAIYCLFENSFTVHCPVKGCLVNDACVINVAITVQKVVGYRTYPDDSKKETTGGQGGAAAPTKLNLDIGKAVGSRTDETADESCFPEGLLIGIPHLDYVENGVGDSVSKELRWNGSLRDVNKMTYYFVLLSLYLQGDHKWKNEEWLAELRDALAISNSDHVVELKRVTSGEYFRASSSSSVMP